MSTRSTSLSELRLRSRWMRAPRPPQLSLPRWRAIEVGRDHRQPTRAPMCAAQRRDTQTGLGFLILFIEEKKRREKIDSPPLFLPGVGFCSWPWVA